jgi:hypothetical protein
VRGLFLAVLGAVVASACGFAAVSADAAPLVLLDGRGWEMVSPVDKNGGEIQPPGSIAGGGVFQAAGEGGAVTFSSVSSFGSDAMGAPEGSQYVSRRGVSGWATENVTAPLSAGAYGEEPDGVPYQLFSGNLSLGLLSAPGGYELRESSGALTAVEPPQSLDLRFAGASPDLEHLVFTTCAPGSGCDLEAADLYEHSSTGWRLLTSPGRLAAPTGAISSDGSRVYWTDGADLYLSEEGTDSVPVDAGAGGGGTFQVASTDGSVAFFTRAETLYRYDVATATITNLTPGAGVIGVLGASADGSTVYYAAAAGLFVHRGGVTTGPFAASADPSSFPPSTGTTRVSADGGRLAFVSSAKLTGFDNTGPGGKPVAEIYLYDAAANHLTCVSCNPRGERPGGPSTLPGAVANGEGEGATRAYKPRVLSSDGNRLFFQTGESLVSGDTNHVRQDVYEWEAGGSGSCAQAAGCLQLISAGASFDSTFVDAGADGGDVFFLTDNSLVKSDPGSVDLYDARVGGGFAEPQPPFVCEEDACQPLPPPPDDPQPGTLVPSLGNPPLHFPKKHKKKRHHKKHHGRKGTHR